MRACVAIAVVWGSMGLSCAMATKWRFLHPVDLVRLINPDELLRLVELDTSVVQQVVDMAVQLAESYLVKRYDIGLAFPELAPWTASTIYEVGALVVVLPANWSVSTAYAIGAQVTYNGLVYQALRATTGDAPGAGFKGAWRGIAWPVMQCATAHTSGSAYDSTKWIMQVRRNAVLLHLVTDIVIYELMARVMPDGMPEIRKDRYEAALAMLSRIATGKQSIELPPAEANTLGSRRIVAGNIQPKVSWE